jgi:hypothetical protein
MPFSIQCKGATPDRYVQAQKKLVQEHRVQQRVDVGASASLSLHELKRGGCGVWYSSCCHEVAAQRVQQLCHARVSVVTCELHG